MALTNKIILPQSFFQSKNTLKRGYFGSIDIYFVYDTILISGDSQDRLFHLLTLGSIYLRYRGLFLRASRRTGDTQHWAMVTFQRTAKV